MNIITISREFGSGGRELGRQIAEILNYDYYDRENEIDNLNVSFLGVVTSVKKKVTKKDSWTGVVLRDKMPKKANFCGLMC